MNKQIRHVGAVLVVLFLVLFAQLNNTQILRANGLNQHPGNNRNAVRDFSAPRGVIQTADGVVLANSVPVDDEYQYLRQYPEGSLFGHLTGFFSFTYGNEGLERQYNDDLTGRTYALRDIGDLLTERVRTNNVTITATKRLQEAARDALGDRRGAVVALQPKTGAVLAMWANPSFDPTALASHDFRAVRGARQQLLDAPGNPLLPRSFRESYPPGSTFKVVTAAAAYERRAELTRRRYPVLTTLDLANTERNLRNFGGSSCGGALPDLMRVSCNTGFAQMGLDLGGQALSEEAGDFGFNQLPPLDMPSVARSRFPSPDSFRRNQPALAYSSIGQQNVSATPLQMALVAAGIANGGTIMEPHLLQEVRNNDGEVVRQTRPRPWLEATSRDSARDMTALMTEVARRGTATAAQVPGVSVAAKTGTAETGGDSVHAWLISFAPSDDPEVAVAVVVENQPGVSETTGGRVAAPIARAVMQAALAEPASEEGR